MRHHPSLDLRQEEADKGEVDQDVEIDLPEPGARGPTLDRRKHETENHPRPRHPARAREADEEEEDRRGGTPHDAPRGIVRKEQAPMIDKDEKKADELPEVGRRDRPRRHSSTARVEAVLRFDMHERLPEKWHLPSARPESLDSPRMSCHPVRGRLEPR